MQPNEPPSFGDPSRYYAQALRAAEAKPSTDEARLSHLLQELDPKLEDRISRAAKQWNQTLREHLRTEMAFRLSTGEETKAVPYRIVTGLPSQLGSIVGALNDSQLRLLLRLPLIENTKSGLDFLAAHESDVERQNLETAAAIVEAKLAELRKLDLKKKLEDIDEDVFGAYFFRLPEIQIYWMAIALVSLALSVDAAPLAVVILLHELAHAYSHLGRDIDSSSWSTEDFAAADLKIVEGIAQFYTAAICTKLKDRYPAALDAYHALLTVQSGPYLVHQGWKIRAGAERPAARVGEVVRASMIECRVRPIRDYSVFESALAHHHQRLA